MSIVTADVDYINTAFEFPELTKIHDIPTYKLLKKVKDELKTNASKVQCDLDGGNHGHLGLLLSDTDYQNVSSKAYVQPKHPGEFSSTENTQYKLSMEREDHKEKIIRRRSVYSEKLRQWNRHSSSN